MTSCSSAPDARSDRPIVGIATLTMVTSSKAMNCPHSSTMSITQRARSLARPTATGLSEVAVIRPRLAPAAVISREPADHGAASNTYPERVRRSPAAPTARASRSRQTRPRPPPTQHLTPPARHTGRGPRSALAVEPAIAGLRAHGDLGLPPRDPAPHPHEGG